MAEITPGNLMIGSIVRINNPFRPSENGKVKIVAEIRRESALLEDPDGGESYAQFYEYIQGVAITPEILRVHFGAVPCTASGCVYMGHPGAWIQRYGDDLWRVIPCYGHFQFPGSMKYVHELQRVFLTLTGTPLELVVRDTDRNLYL